MPTNKLTDAKCKAARPGDKAQKLFDGGGLFLYLTPAGGKIWRWAYRVDGKPKTMSFGAYPVVSLSEARELRDKQKGKLVSGSDPMAERRTAQQQASKPKMTLAEASAKFWEGRGDITPGYRANAERGIEQHLFPGLGSRDIGTIDRADLLAELNAMDAKGLHVYVRKVRMWVSQVFDWAIENDLATINPAALIDPRKAFAHAQVEHFASIDLGEVPALIQRLELEGELQSVLACRLLALTWTRTVELRLMEWSELDGDTWRIPKERMKRKRDHLVPLSTQASSILDKLKARAGHSKYVFPAEHRIDRPMSENTILYLLWRIGYRGRMTGHGWRSVGSTWANENGFNRDAIERQLAHAPGDKVRAAYNRAEYLPDRRVMLQAWADWLDSCQVDAGSAEG